MDAMLLLAGLALAALYLVVVISWLVPLAFVTALAASAGSPRRS